MADGSTYKEAVDNIEVVIQEWIEAAKDLGRSIPKPKAAELRVYLEYGLEANCGTASVGATGVSTEVFRRSHAPAACTRRASDLGRPRSGTTRKR